ncbi:polyubiquitin 4 [Anaeramoeba flamelloides]|uniref:Polyubiquitin 4 n=1 Tax=Anaeramoeba flamelloides TaxID=1746091 RepID=A0ABQ8X1X5_9EUKA|nr:polyubiquitin 4 [Anaeramoeba flamelloides]
MSKQELIEKIENEEDNLESVQTRLEEIEEEMENISKNGEEYFELLEEKTEQSESFLETIQELLRLEKERTGIYYDKRGTNKDNYQGQEIEQEEISQGFKFTVSIHLPNSKVVYFKASPLDKISTILSYVEDQSNLDVSQHHLTLGNKTLSSGYTLDDYSVWSECSLKLQKGSTGQQTSKGFTSFYEIEENISKSEEFGNLFGSYTEIKDVDLEIQWAAKSSVLTIKINPNERIKELKEKISQKSQIPVGQQSIQLCDNWNFKNGRELLNNEHVGDLFLNTSSILLLTAINPEMTITLLRKTDDDLNVTIASDSTIEGLKEAVYREHNIVEELQIIFSTCSLGRVIPQYAVLRELGIVDGSRLRIVIRPIKSTFPITVLEANGQATDLEIGLEETVGGLQKMIKQQCDIAIDDQILSFDYPLLNSTDRLVDRYVEEKSVISVISRQNKGEGNTPLTVKFLYGKTITVKANLNNLVLFLFHKIEDSEGIPKDQQRLIFNSEQLAQDRTLRSYGIKENDLITCLLRLRGGKPIINLYDYRTEQEILEQNSRKLQISSVHLQLSKGIEFTSIFPKPQVKDQENNSICWKDITVQGQKESQQLIFNNRKYAYLFWECDETDQQQQYMIKKKYENQQLQLSKLLDDEFSFCVNIDEIAEFLAEKLSDIGLSLKERDDLITYWVPQLEQRQSVHWIQLQILDETSQYSEIAKLEINPQPDVLRRIFVLFKPVPEKMLNLGENLNVEPLVKRKGFVAVEWGGMIIWN